MARNYWMNIARIPIGEQIKEARERKEMKQITLGTICGLTDGHISAIENGKRAPRLSTLKKIAQVLHEPFVIGPDTTILKEMK